MKRFAHFLILLSLCACGQKGPDLPGVTSMVDLENISHEMIVLGSKLDDPYTLENMQAAYDAIYGTKSSRRELTPTDIYVRFLPKGEEQYDRLKSMGIDLVDHPVDYQIITEGDYYIDPTLPEDQITWQYAVVSKSFSLPSDIEYEVLDECYIAAHDAKTKSDGVDWVAVERLSFELTGNSDMLAPETRAEEGPQRPHGRLTVMDDKTGEPEGVKGVMVNCNSFVKFGSAYTDANGYYQMQNEFVGDIRYRLVFQNKKGFSIGFNLLLVPASISTLGEGPAEGVSAEISVSSERKLFARTVVNNAGYDYFERCDGGESGFISAPPSSLRIWIFQHLGCSSTAMLQHGAMVDHELVKKYLGEYMSLIKNFLPDITIGVNEARSFSTIYASATHEFAHASHFSKVGTPFWNKYIYYILESFVATGGATYGSGVGGYAGHCAIGEMWGYFMENLVYMDRYGVPSPSLGVSYWFSPTPLRYINERGLTEYDIFRALDGEVTSVATFEAHLKQLYPDYVNVIEEAFARY